MIAPGIIAVMAFDRSMRTMDQDGRLHVALTRISKANVCEYAGAEIPGCADLGLDPNKLYRMLRCPEELERAASTFNNLPLLRSHQPVTAKEHAPELVIGSTGTDAVFEAPYLSNSLVVWDAGEIAKIEREVKEELSCAYYYRPDMTPGMFEGQPYDGVMRDIRGNHVALVVEGRAGKDVVVADSKPGHSEPLSLQAIQEMDMAKTAKKLSAKAILVRGALTPWLHTKLAQDAKVDLNKILLGTTTLNYKAAKPTIITKLEAATKGKLAQDATLADVHGLLDSLDKEDVAEDLDDSADAPVPPVDPDADPVVDDIQDPDNDGDVDKKPDGTDVTDPDLNPDADEDQAAGGDDADAMTKIMGYLETKLKPEELDELRALAKGGSPAKDEEDPDNNDQQDDKEPAMTKGAMDAAIKAATKQAEDAVIARLAGVREAEKVVHPWVGELAMAQDSAEKVYKTALDTLGVKVDGVHPSALRHILEAQPKPNAKKDNGKAPAMDAAGHKSFAEMFPDVSRLKYA